MFKKNKFKLTLSEDNDKIVNHEFNKFEEVDNVFKQLRKKFR